MTIGGRTGPWWSSRLSLVGVLALLVCLTAPDVLDAKRTKRPFRPPLKILNVAISPTPFVPGRGWMAMTVSMALPKKLRGTSVLEVSSLISFPSKSSIRFLVGRRALDVKAVEAGASHMSMTLLWDGHDQHQRYVRHGTYHYEIRAKLMSTVRGFLKATTVSLITRGTLEVAPRQDAVKPPPSGEPLSTAPIPVFTPSGEPVPHSATSPAGAPPASEAPSSDSTLPGESAPRSESTQAESPPPAAAPAPSDKTSP